MINYKPYYLDEIKNNLKNIFPIPADYAFREEKYAHDILNRIRENESSFAELPIFDLNYAYQLSAVCSDEEFVLLKKVFSERLTTFLFDVGWIYFQLHPDNERSALLFSIACEWMKINKRELFDNSYIGIAGLPLENIYMRSFEIIRIEKLTIEDFCEKFSIMTDTLFYKHLQLTYFANCEKDELLSNELLISGLIADSDPAFLRPVIRNYTAKISHDEMSQLISDTIVYRLVNEPVDETLGLSPNMLQRVRRLRFSSVLEGCVNRKSEKLDFYNSIAGMIKNVELLNASFFVIDFGKYKVLDSSDWSEYAYAYIPQVFTPLYEAWKKADYPEDYWPAMQETEISTAHDIILGLNKSNVIRLYFKDFDKLYSKDLLTITRY